MDSNAKDILKFIELVNVLKHAPRRGWIIRNIKNPETISGHMYAMGMMTFLLVGNDTSLDRLKCMQLALVHDLAESIVGDITPQDNIPVVLKHEMEDNAMKKITSLLDENTGQFIYALYKEYESKTTPEAKFVKELDLFDMIFSAASYEKQNNSVGSLQEFFDAAQNKFEHPLVQKLSSELISSRNSLLNLK